MFNVGDLVNVSTVLANKFGDPEIANRVAKVESVDDNGIFLVIRPKYYREVFEVSLDEYSELTMNTPFVVKTGTGRRGRPSSYSKMIDQINSSELPEEKRFELYQSLQTGEIQKELTDIWNAVNAIHNKIGTNNGVTALYWHILSDIKSHIETVEFQRG